MDTWVKRLRSQMKKLKLTQEMVATRAGITRSAICHYLSSRRVPSLATFIKLATVLECDPAWLQYGHPDNVQKAQPQQYRDHGGGKLNRSKIIQARLDPILHKAAEKMAKQERRTLSSFIEMLVAEKSKKKI